MFIKVWNIKLYNNKYLLLKFDLYNYEFETTLNFTFMSSGTPILCHYCYIINCYSDIFFFFINILTHSWFNDTHPLDIKNPINLFQLTALSIRSKRFTSKISDMDRFYMRIQQLIVYFGQCLVSFLNSENLLYLW